MADPRPPGQPPADLAGMAARLRAAARPLGVDLADAVARCQVAFAAELLRWNARVDLVGPTDLSTLLARHVLDSLALLPWVRESGIRTLADLGSGAGLPALPLALAEPSLAVLSIEPRARRAAFQRHVVRQFGLGHVKVLGVRVGPAGSRPPAALLPTPDAIVARAFAALPEYLALAARLVRVGGFVVAMRGPDGVVEMDAAAASAAALGLAPETSRRYELPGDLTGRTAPRGRVLVVFRRR